MNSPRSAREARALVKAFEFQFCPYCKALLPVGQTECQPPCVGTFDLCEVYLAQWFISNGERLSDSIVLSLLRR